MKLPKDNIRQGLFVSLFLVAAFSSCTKDASRDVGKPANSIGFAVSADNSQPIVRQMCNEENDTYASTLLLEGGDKPMYLHVTSEEGIAASDATVSRATPVPEATIVDAGILAFNFNGDWHESLCPSFMYNVRIAKASGWTTDYHYPNNGSKVRFYAYSPYGCKGATISGKTDAGEPVIRYAVPASAVEQSDLLVAQSNDVVCSAENKKVNLDFRHALTAVRFVTGHDIAPCKIKSITLKNVFTQGSCTIGSAPVWNNQGSAGDFTIAINKDFDGSADIDISLTEQTMMMIPQALPDGAYVEVVLNDGDEHTLTSSLAGSVWKAGNTVTYHISSSSISGDSYLSVVQPSLFDYSGGKGAFKVSSYRLRADGKKMAVAWRVKEYSEDGGNSWSTDCPAWLTMGVTSGTGGSAGERVDISVQAQTQQDYIDMCKYYDFALKHATLVSSYDLSTNGGTAPMNTANCYIVNAAGTYSLPLVYGNAIKDGKTNESSYCTGKSGSTIMKHFINHLGNIITDPYIYNNIDCEPYSAVLLWQDVKNLVTNVALSADKHSLTFEVPRANISQGNAVVAICNKAGDAIWSWHIWVTAYRLGENLKTVTYGGATFNFMPINLGWCFTYGITYCYPSRTLLVKLAQVNGKKCERVVTVYQSDAYFSEEEAWGNNTFYQWGRKDPFIPAIVADNKDKTIYDAKGNIATRQPGVEWKPNEYIKMGIANPSVFCTANSSSFDVETYCNLWNLGQDYNFGEADSIIKTIYDPCPVGFAIPMDGSLKWILNEDCVKAKLVNGTTFFCDAGRNRIIFFPISGYRHFETGAFINYIGLYWTSTSKYTRKSGCYHVNDVLSYSEDQGHALSVRPIQQQQ